MLIPFGISCATAAASNDQSVCVPSGLVTVMVSHECGLMSAPLFDNARDGNFGVGPHVEHVERMMREHRLTGECTNKDDSAFRQIADSWVSFPKCRYRDLLLSGVLVASF